MIAIGKFLLPSRPDRDYFFISVVIICTVVRPLCQKHRMVTGDVNCAAFNLVNFALDEIVISRSVSMY